MTASRVTKTTTEVFDSWLSYEHWDVTTLTYSFPTSGAYYTYQDTNAVIQLTEAQQDAVRDVLESISSFTGMNFVEVAETSSTEATLRFATEVGLGGGYAFVPGDYSHAGDSFYGTNTLDPVIGNEPYLYFLHEIGHNFGLHHGHEFEEFSGSEFDSQEYTVVTYSDYVGDTDIDSFDSGDIDWAQTYMQLDIAAMQYLYGANYASSGEVWSGDTVYTFDPLTGEMSINGEGIGTPEGNRIFRTIWDGNGTDTYDLSNYSTDLQIDLSAGGWSTFSTDQLADLNRHSTDPKYLAAGNVANARLVDGDVRALIENAIGGSGDDNMRGNEVTNILKGNAGNDRLSGMAGDDRLLGQAGKDSIYGAAGDDTIYGGNNADLLSGGAGADVMYGGTGWDTLLGGNGRDTVSGERGNDVLQGGQGADVLIGGKGVDDLYGGSGRDVFLFNSVGDSSFASGGDTIKDFEIGLDTIDLSELSSTTLTLSLNSSGDTGSGSVFTTKSSVNTLVFADVDGDGTTDFRLFIEGVTGLTAGDFLL